MAAPSDESLPLEFSGPPATRRAPKKLQNIGIGQFRNHGVPHHFQPGSAAAIFNKQKAEQQMEAWLRRMPAKTSQDDAKDKGKKKAKKGAKSKKDEDASGTTKDAGVEVPIGNLSTGPAVAVAQMGQGKAIVEHGKTLDQTQGDASNVAQAPTRKAIKIVTVDRRVKPTQGAWGRRAVENVKTAAAKTVDTSYATTPITFAIADGEAFTTIIPTPRLPTPEAIIPRAAAAKKPKGDLAQNASTKTVRKPSTKSRASKKSQAPMWSDSDQDDQDEEDINDLLISSRTAGSTTKTPRGRTTKNSSTSKNSNPRKKSTRDQPTPQKKKRQVRFAPTANPEEEDKISSSSSSNTTTTTHQDPKTTSQKQQTNHPPPTPYTTLNLPQVNFHIPTSQLKPNQTPSPANLADDEDSQIVPAKKQAPTSAQKKRKTTSAPTPNPKPTFTPNPSSASAKKKRAQEQEQEQEQEQDPPRRKGVAHHPQPKRARATTETANNNDNGDDEANDSAAPASKKAKTTAEMKKPKKKDDLPARKKKGVATKAKAKRARAVVREESSDDDDDDDDE